MNIYRVDLSEKAKRDLRKIPMHIVIKVYEWIEAVASDGLNEVRKIPGYHDEPLKGSRKQQRSIRLSKSYRAIYMIVEKEKLEFAEIIEVNKHDY